LGAAKAEEATISEYNPATDKTDSPKTILEGVLNIEISWLK
jgi:hypothetical protein